MTFWYLPGSIDTIFWVAYELHRVLEDLKGVGFQSKNCFTKMLQISRKLILALDNRKKSSKKYWYDIMVTAWVSVELMGESMRLVCVQLQERYFEKKSLTEVMEIFNNYYATISFRGMCTVQEILGFCYQKFRQIKDFQIYLWIEMLG